MFCGPRSCILKVYRFGNVLLCFSRIISASPGTDWLIKYSLRSKTNRYSRLRNPSNLSYEVHPDLSSIETSNVAFSLLLNNVPLHLGGHISGFKRGRTGFIKTLTLSLLYYNQFPASSDYSVFNTVELSGISVLDGDVESVSDYSSELEDYIRSNEALLYELMCSVFDFSPAYLYTKLLPKLYGSDTKSKDSDSELDEASEVSEGISSVADYKYHDFSMLTGARGVSLIPVSLLGRYNSEIFNENYYISSYFVKSTVPKLPSETFVIESYSWEYFLSSCELYKSKGVFGEYSDRFVDTLHSVLYFYCTQNPFPKVCSELESNSMPLSLEADIAATVSEDLDDEEIESESQSTRAVLECGKVSAINPAGVSSSALLGSGSWKSVPYSKMLYLSSDSIYREEEFSELLACSLLLRGTKNWYLSAELLHSLMDLNMRLDPVNGELLWIEDYIEKYPDAKSLYLSVSGLNKVSSELLNLDGNNTSVQGVDKEVSYLSGSRRNLSLMRFYNELSKESALSGLLVPSLSSFNCDANFWSKSSNLSSLSRYKLSISRNASLNQNKKSKFLRSLSESVSLSLYPKPPSYNELNSYASNLHNEFCVGNRSDEEELEFSNPGIVGSLSSGINCWNYVGDSIPADSKNQVAEIPVVLTECVFHSGLVRRISESDNFILNKESGSAIRSIRRSAQVSDLSKSDAVEYIKKLWSKSFKSSKKVLSCSALSEDLDVDLSYYFKLLRSKYEAISTEKAGWSLEEASYSNYNVSHSRLVVSNSVEFCDASLDTPWYDDLYSVSAADWKKPVENAVLPDNCGIEAISKRSVSPLMYLNNVDDEFLEIGVNLSAKVRRRDSKRVSRVTEIKKLYGSSDEDE